MFASEWGDSQAEEQPFHAALYMISQSSNSFTVSPISQRSAFQTVPPPLAAST
jgi:hypothetical protein